MTTTHYWEDLLDLAADQHRTEEKWDWPWMEIGVFPVEDDPDPSAWWSCFVYTVGMDPDTEMWIAAASIEGRFAGYDLIGQILNVLAAGWNANRLKSGDDVILALGIPNAEGEWDRDEDAVFWIGDPGYRQRYQTNMSPAHAVIPVRWSSPLGWPE